MLTVTPRVACVCVGGWVGGYMCLCLYVTLHHKMSRNVPDSHFPVFIFSESEFYTINNGLVAELHVSEHGGTTFGTFEKTCFRC